MNELVIQKHNFEKAKNQLKQFSLTKPEELALKKVDVDGGLFNWFDHKVTGQELNELTNQIQGYLIKFNTLNTKFIKEFGEVYNALEALDKEYIQAILISIKASEKASMEAKDAQKDINKTIEVQKQTITVLKKFKDKLDKYEHLENVDEVWKDTQKFAKEIKSVNKEIARINETFEAQANKLVTLDQFRDKLNKYKHLSSIDILWEDAQTFQEKVKSFNTQIENINNLILVQGQDIESLNQFKEELNKYNHLGDIDQLWEDVKTISSTIKSINNQIESINNSFINQGQEVDALNQFKEELSKFNHLNDIDHLWEETQTILENIQSITAQIVDINRTDNAQGQEIDALNQFRAELSEFNHLKDIDQLWEDSRKSNTEVQSLQEKIEGLKNQLNVTNQQINEDKTNYESQINTLFKKTKIAYTLAGGSIGIVIIQIVLNILGIL